MGILLIFCFVNTTNWVLDFRTQLPKSTFIQFFFNQFCWLSLTCRGQMWGLHRHRNKNQAVLVLLCQKKLKTRKPIDKIQRQRFGIKIYAVLHITLVRFYLVLWLTLTKIIFKLFYKNLLSRLQALFPFFSWFFFQFAKQLLKTLSRHFPAKTSFVV